MLVVVDDLPAPTPQSDMVLKKLREFIPQRFRRLITQRHRPLSGAAIDLGVLIDGASGLELLSLRAGVRGSERIQREEAAGLQLVERVGRLPLSLVLLPGRLQRLLSLTLPGAIPWQLVGYGGQAQAMAPADGGLCFSLGLGLKSLGQQAEAGHEFSQARRLGTEQEGDRLISSSWNGTGDVPLAQGDGPTALKAYQADLTIGSALT